MLKNLRMDLSVVAAATLLVACGGGAPPPETAAPAHTEAPAPVAAPVETAPAEPAAYAVAPVTDGGTVSGKVTLAGAAPVAEAVEVTKDGQTCGTEQKMETVKAGAAGELANAVVWIEGIAAGKDWAAANGAMDQKNCHYAPHVQVVPMGGNIDIMNSDPVLHNVHAYSGGETLFNLAQPTQGMSTPMKLKRAGPVEFKCDVHSWMHAWAFVSPHPYYAVTGDDGSFSIDMVPPGTYKVKAWHESLGEKEMDLTLEASGVATAQFSFGAN